MKWAERLYPFILAWIAPSAFGYAMCKGVGPTSADQVELVRVGIDLGGVSLGFLISTGAIIFGVLDRPAVKWQRDAGGLDQIVMYLLHAALAWLVVLVGGFGFLLFVRAETTPIVSTNLFAAWLYLLAVGVLATFRASYFLLSTLRRSVAPEKK